MDFRGDGSVVGASALRYRPMTRKPANRDQALDLLKTAIAALGEHIVEKGASRLSISPRAAQCTMAALEELARDCLRLSEACAVLIKRGDLLD